MKKRKIMKSKKTIKIQILKIKIIQLKEMKKKIMKNKLKIMKLKMKIYLNFFLYKYINLN